MPESGFPIRIRPGEQFQGSIVSDGACGVPYLSIYTCSQYLSCQSFADGFGDVQCSDAAFIFSDGAVRKSDLDHKGANLTDSDETRFARRVILQMVQFPMIYLYN